MYCYSRERCRWSVQYSIILKQPEKVWSRSLLFSSCGTELACVRDYTSLDLTSPNTALRGGESTGDSV